MRYGLYQIFKTTLTNCTAPVVGIIRIANFVNSVLTSVITRKKAYAMLQSFGMTGKQMKRIKSCQGCGLMAP